MVITVKAKSPGRWNVYRSEGLVTNISAGYIVRLSGMAMITYYFDAEGIRHEIGSNPQKWPSTVRSILNRKKANEA
jgi:hypothetical protein